MYLYDDVDGRDETNLHVLWQKILTATKKGDVLATVGTGSLSPMEEKEFGLVGDHNYSILGTSTS